MNFHSDTFKLEVEAPQLRQLTGKSLQLDVRMAFAIMTGQAILDGTVLDEPQCMATYADMSPVQPAAAALPGIPAASPFSQAAALSITPTERASSPSVGWCQLPHTGNTSGTHEMPACVPSGKLFAILRKSHMQVKPQKCEELACRGRSSLPVCFGVKVALSALAGLSSSLSVGDLSSKGTVSGKQGASKRRISFNPALRLSVSDESSETQKSAADVLQSNADALQAVPTAPEVSTSRFWLYFDLYTSLQGA